MDIEDDRYHYHVIARAIRHIDAAGGQELSLSELAAKLDMSPAHFQRVFSRWAGVSPKRYQQYLRLAHARELLTERATLLETAMETGLSGTGRLHDLFVRWEAMRPGDYARRGAGVTIRWGWFDSPFGPSLVMATDTGICGIGFAAEAGKAATMADLMARWPAAEFLEAPEELRSWAQAALGVAGDPGTPPPLHVIGAPFQIKVWEALLRVPPGRVTTYSEIASSIGNPDATRAVGSAVGRNPVSLLIPCHRALRKSGGLGGYHWGLPVKRAILAREAARAEA